MGSSSACLHVRLGQFFVDRGLASQLLGLALEGGLAAHQVDRAAPADGHEPGARIVRNARLRPLLERRDERVLCQVLGQADVADDPRQAGDEARRLDPPDGLDRAVGIGGHGF